MGGTHKPQQIQADAVGVETSARVELGSVVVQDNHNSLRATIPEIAARNLPVEKGSHNQFFLDRRDGAAIVAVPLRGEDGARLPVPIAANDDVDALDVIKTQRDGGQMLVTIPADGCDALGIERADELDVWLDVELNGVWYRP